MLGCNGPRTGLTDEAHSHMCSIGCFPGDASAAPGEPLPEVPTAEQLEALATVPAEPVSVRAGHREDGVEELVRGHAVAWTTRAVRVRWGVPSTNTRPGCGPIGGTRSPD